MLYSPSDALNSFPAWWSCPPPETATGLKHSSWTENQGKHFRQHSWPKVQLKKSHIHNSPLILTLAEHAGQLVQCHPPGFGSSWRTWWLRPLLDSDQQSYSSCTTSSETPLWNIPHRHTLDPSLFTLKFSCHLNKISRLLAAAPTFTHWDLHWVSKISFMVETQDHPKRPSMLGRHQTSDNKKS